MQAHAVPAAESPSTITAEGAVGPLLQLQLRGRFVPLRERFSHKHRPSRVRRVSGWVLNLPLTPMQAEGIFLLCSLWRTHGEAKMGRLKNKMKQKGVGEGSFEIKFYYQNLVWLQIQRQLTEKCVTFLMYKLCVS